MSAPEQEHLVATIDSHGNHRAPAAARLDIVHVLKYPIIGDHKETYQRAYKR